MTDYSPRDFVTAAVMKLSTAFLFAAMAVQVRYLGDRFPVGQVIFFRAIFAFVPIWGEYLFSFTFTSTTNAMPMSVGIRFFEPSPATGQYTFNVATAAALVMFLPSMLVYLLLQRWFTKGMMEGALKF